MISWPNNTNDRNDSDNNNDKFVHKLIWGVNVKINMNLAVKIDLTFTNCG